MSKNTSAFAQPGIEQLIPGAELPVGVKVTGRNMSAVTLLASVSGETLGRRTVVSSFFDVDGSLSYVELVDAEGKVTVNAGQYMLLGDDRQSVVIMDESDYRFYQTLLPLVNALDNAFASVFGL